MALEQFANAPIPSNPALAWTTLAAGIDASVTTITVASAAAFPSTVQFRILIENEHLLVTAGAASTTWTVTRGIEGTTGAAHALGVSVYHVLTAAALLNSPGPMTTAGDLVYLNSALQPARLGAPSNGNYGIQWTAGVPSYIAMAGGGDAMTSATLAQFAPTTSAQLAGVISDETGSGALVFGTNPTVTTKLTITGATETTSNPVIDTTQTWNASGTTFTAIKLDVTSTASAAASLLLDLQVATTSVFAVEKSGAVNPTTAALSIGSVNGSTTAAIINSSGVILRSGSRYGWGASSGGAGGAADLLLTRDTAGVLAQRNGTNAQTFRLYNTYTDASNYERLACNWASNIATIRTEAAGTGTARVLNITYGSSGFLALRIPISETVDFGILMAQGASTTALANGRVCIGENATATSGTHSTVVITEDGAPTATSTMVFRSLVLSPTINFSNGTPGAGSYEALKIAVTETALPTGTNYLIRASASSGGTTARFAVRNTGLVELIASTTATAMLNLPHGSAPSAPVDGDIWTTTAGLFVRINGTTVGPLS
jgi:hypothetical protein